jgi:peptidyl-prolyl cis-trans isomerase B (cyclophilin B)
MAARTRSGVIAAAVAVAAVVLAVVGLQVFGGDGAAEGPGAHGCTEPPPLPDDVPSFSEAPDADLAQGTTWRATLHTNCGDIVLELYGDKAPQTVSSFLFLAEHGYWQDSPCHRLVTSAIYVLQCGDPTGTGTGNPGYGFGIENAPRTGLYPRGTVAMARTEDPNSNGGQFFIVFDKTRLPVAGGGYSIFGRIVSGMDIVDRIAAAGVGGSLGPTSPKQPISILDVTTEKL